MSDSGTPLGVAFARLAEADPDRPALTHEGITLSRRALEERTNRLARAYADLGVQRDDFVTIGLPNGLEFYEAVLATWKVGATPQPISSRLPAIERAAIIELADPAMVVGVDQADAGGRPSLAPGFAPPHELSADPMPAAVPSSWKAPTSGGSTGRPKLIIATQPGMLEQLAPTPVSSPWCPGDRSWSPGRCTTTARSCSPLSGS